MEYDHKKIESKWQKIWEKKKIFAADDKSKKPKFYGLIEFPYPSGDGLHVGHIRSNTAMDVISRKRRMEGFNVLYPIGWDAFGLPTENYAIKTGIHPIVVTKKNTDTFRHQLKELGFSFDWSREINTTDPNYYKWTQWIFLQFLKQGLAYKKKMPINWCPQDKIGLANEEVVDGKCERCGTSVEKRDKEQWMLAITKYADRLDKDLDEGIIIRGEKRDVPKKILVGTRNPAKVNMVKAAFPATLGIEFVSINDLPPIDDSALVEGENFRENARKKAEFYFKKTGIPTISTDHILWVEKFPENGGNIVHIRKLANPASERATDEEVAKWVENFVDKYGESKAAFNYAVAYTDKSGTVDFAIKQREYLLQKSKSPLANEGYVFDRYLKDLETGELRVEQHFEKGFFHFNDFIRKEFVKIFDGEQRGTPPDYLEKIKIQQKNWIGKSEGVNLKFKVKDLNINFEMFDSVPQTHMAQTFTVIAPEHPMLYELVKGTKFEKPVMEKAKEIIKKRMSGVYEETGEMDGIFTGRYIEYSPAKRDLPIWVASFVVADYGTGVVNCSFHDERDYAFAKKFNIPLHPVTEPLFINNDGQSAARRDLPFEERQAITAIVKHWSEDKYIGLKWKKVDWDTFITGGIEDGQTPEEAARREVTEETGYKNMKLIRELPRYHSKFFHIPKNVNRFAHFDSFIFQLTDGAKDEITTDEYSKHEVVWLTPKELESFRLPDGQRFIWQAAQGIEKPIIKNGILTEPPEFKGREWNEVREDIINYMVGKGYANRAVNYKLRDWVFSRQHYWGEPIPVVFCEKCQNKKYNFVFIHGRGGAVNKNFFPELKKQLVDQGHKVFAEDLPVGKSGPKIDEQVEFLLKNTTFDEDTVIVAHSMGGLAVHKLLPKLKIKIHKVVFVDCFTRPNFSDKRREDVEKSTDWKFDFKKAKSKVKFVEVLGDGAEDKIPKEENEILAKAYKTRAIFAQPTDGHFTDTDEPAVFGLVVPSSYVPVPEKDLPVELPKVEKYQPTDTGESPLAAITKWVNTKCPHCGSPARRETDTMPNWAGSSWYYLRYIDPKNSREFVGREKLNYWCRISKNSQTTKLQNFPTAPVDWYNGGMEHTTLHLLYSRFWHKFLFDLGLVPTNEPYKKRTSHGLILAEGGVKMSKSKGNVINPDDLINRFGADALRLYEMFMGPFDQAIAWNTDGIVGTRRFVEKVWRIASKVSETSEAPAALEAILHKTIKKVDEDIEEMRFNTAVSALMICANELDSVEDVPKEIFEPFLKLLSPFAPHLCEELWQKLGNNGLIVERSWPSYDPNKIQNEAITIVVQVNGKVRGQFSATPDILEPEVIEKAKTLPALQPWLVGKSIKKAIFVKGRLVNLVV